MPLTQIQINSLNALFSAMDKDELDEVLDMLLDEAFRREWEENQPPMAHLEMPVIIESLRH